MKRIALILILLLIPCLAFAEEDCNPCKEKMELARMTAVMAGGGGAAAPAVYCASCPDAANGGDTLCEVCDATADGVCNWTSGVETNCTIVWNHALDNDPALGCTNIQTNYVADVEKTDTTSAACFEYYDMGADVNVLYVQFYFKLISENIIDTEYWTIFSILSATSGSAQARIRLYQNSSVHSLAAGWHTGAAFSTELSGANIVVDTWYGVRMKFDATNDTLDWWIDYAGNGTWVAQTQITGAHDRAHRYLSIGQEFVSVRPINYQIAGLKVDTAEFTDCAR